MQEREVSISEREAELARESQRLYPDILARIKRRDDLLAITETVAAEAGVDTKTAYKWVHLVEEEFKRRRRAVAIIGASFIWVCAFSFAAGVFVRFAEAEPAVAGVGGDAILFVFAGLAGALGIYVSRRADALALSRHNPFVDRGE